MSLCLSQVEETSAQGQRACDLYPPYCLPVGSLSREPIHKASSKYSQATDGPLARRVHLY